MADNPTQAVLAPAPQRVGLPKLWRTLRRWPLLPLAMLLLVVFAGLFAPWIAPEDPRKGDLRARMVPPAWLEGGSVEHLLGTDHLGRDIFSRIVHGARISLVVAAVTLGLGGTTGTVLGLLAGWYGKWIDEIIMRIVDIALAIPLVLVALVMVVAVGQAFPSDLGGQTGLIILVLAGFFWVRFARLVRGEVLQLKTLDYVALAKVAGASIPRILFVHIFPGVINTLIVLATLQVWLRHPGGIDSQLPGGRRPAAHPGLGFHGGRGPGLSGRSLVDFHHARCRHTADGNVPEPVRRLATRHPGPQAAAIGNELGVQSRERRGRIDRG